ncbi:hypothetical protein [Flavobacterium sp.]|jgi:hypothetical protein|uniref:hypothetical protein n=1 Tax=Flavobacterium sp. TaxID=239 RepID=UPI0037BE3657
MKNIFTLLTLFSFTSIFAIDRFVDPNLSSGNGTTLFTTITSAVNAAVNGDRIIVATNTYNEGTLTIDKSLKIIPQTAGATINFNANINIAGFSGMKLEIIGFNLGIYSISSNPISNGIATNRAKVSIIECSISNVVFDNDFYELNLLKSIISGNATFRFGNIVSNSMLNCYLMDESLTNQNAMDKNFIVNNTITNDTFIFNDNYKFILSNNSLKNLFVSKWVLALTNTNYIMNNVFNSNCKLYFASFFQLSSNWGGCGPDVSCYLQLGSVGLVYNFKFVNNKFLGSILYARRNTSLVFPNAFGCLVYGSSYNTVVNEATYSSTATDCPNVYANGFFEWSYNGVTNLQTLNGSLVYTNISGPTNDIDGGNPNHDYYDIDLTINDRGINGGPYSQLNYNATNPNNSKAFIFDLEMPTDLFEGQNVNIKAKGYHKN